ncbi:MAG: xanthine dehydrogenase family protein molybdopterin-binding subunit, partial [Halocynthiibacter sp.]
PAQAYYNSALLGELVPGKGYDRGNFAHALGETLGVLGKVLNMQVTGGSSAMKDGFTEMRLAGASAREALKEAASVRLGVAKTQLKTENGQVIAPDGTMLAYTELAAEAGQMDLSEPDLRPASEWKYIGKNMPRVDMVGKVTGTAQYGMDVRPEGLKFAALRANPKRSGMVRFDASTAETMPGVDSVHDLGDAIAVVASNTWLAMQAAETVEITWEEANYPNETDQIFERIEAGFDTEANSTLRDDGDAAAGAPSGSTALEASYKVPYLAHAAMEPLNATVLYTGDAMEVWSGNQGPMLHRQKAAAEAGLEEDKVTLHTPYLGGGFGRRGDFDYTAYAARLGVQMQGTPVMLTWSREEDMRHDFYRPGALARMKGAVQDGRAVLLDAQVSGQSTTVQIMKRWMDFEAGSADKGHVDALFNAPYAIENHRVRGYHADVDVPVGAWRSVAASFNAFFQDSFMDEMAHAAGVDPLEFRLQHMREEFPEGAACLEKVREMSGWTGSTPKGVGRGVGFAYSFGTPVAQVVEVVEQDGSIHVNKVWIACDMGTALDPSIIEAQMFGGMVYGLSAAIHGEITFSEGEVEQFNFPDYDATRMHTMPEVEVAILEAQKHLGGAGEPGTPPIAPALANALFDLTGTRAREVPLNKTFDFKF